MTASFLAAAALASLQPAPCAVQDSRESQPKEIAGVECGWVAVPRDPSQPDGKTIRLWIARIKASGTAKADPILYINGGPGIATVDSILPALTPTGLLASMRQDRDIILFDQRGSGRSEEKLCPELGKQLKAVADEGLAPEAEEERGRALFVRCSQKLAAQGIDLNTYSTDTTVRDMEALRKMLGVERWNLMSVSYGTLVALHAMRTYPGTIRSAILNSPYPPNSMSWAEQASVAASSYAAIDRACAEQEKCHARFGPLVPKLEATLARLEEAPIVDGDRKITGRLFAQALWPLAVQSGTVRFVPLAIDRAHSGDREVIKGLVRTFAVGDPFGGLSPAQGYAIACHESGRTQAWYSRARVLYPALVSPAPDDSFDKSCAAYRPGFANAEFFAPVASDIPTLLYAGSLDAATPVLDAYQATRFLTRATLVEVKGASHAPMSRDDCTRQIALDFIGRPEAAPDTSCLAKRPPIEFAEDGLSELFAPAN